MRRKMKLVDESCEIKRPLIQEVGHHLFNWLEAYLWIPLAILSIPLLSYFAYFLTGRSPRESLDWLPEFGFRILQCVVVIVLVSVSRQATGIWMTKEEQIANPKLAMMQRVSSLTLFILWAYILTH
jgi:hypothetical protein